MSADDLLVVMASYAMFVLSVAWLVAMLLTIYIGFSHFMYCKRAKGSRKKDKHKIDI